MSLHKYKVGQEVIIRTPNPDDYGYTYELLKYVGKKAILVRPLKRYPGRAFWAIIVGGMDGGMETPWVWDEKWMVLAKCPCGIKNCITNHKER